MEIVLIIITLFFVMCFGSVISLISHAQNMPSDYDLTEAEIKLKKEIENENYRKA